jgi:hypothetical protein
VNPPSVLQNIKLHDRMIKICGLNIYQFILSYYELINTSNDLLQNIKLHDRIIKICGLSIYQFILSYYELINTSNDLLQNYECTKISALNIILCICDHWHAKNLIKY